MLGLIILTVSLFLSAVYLIRKWNQVVRRYPPGPWSIPLLGHLHLLGDQPHVSLMNMHAKYGPIIACDFGSFRGVVLSDYQHIKEAMNDISFAGRPKLRVFQERTGGVIKGVIFTEGQEWLEQRRFTLRHLRDFGFGKKTQEALIQDEVDELIVGLKKDVGDPISTRNRFSAAVVNALWTMITGVRHSQDDEKLQQVLQLMTEAMADPSAASLFMPWLTKLAPEWSGWNYFMRDVKPTIDFLQSFIDEHRSTFAPGQPRDFTDAYMDEIASAAGDPKSSFHGKSGEISLLATLLDLFFASVETTSHTLSWAMLYLALDENKHAQDEVYDEISRCVGNSRTPCLADRPHLPYTEATIMEVMRIATVLPIGVFHNTMRDVEFHGYKIPRDTMVLTNLYAVHHGNHWSQPEVFDSVRFLSPDRSRVEKPAAFMPFGTGKRVCLGETLARDQLFLILAAILQSFKVSLDPAGGRPSLLPMPMSPISSPQPHKVVFSLRQC